MKNRLIKICIIAMVCALIMIMSGTTTGIQSSGIFVRNDTYQSYTLIPMFSELRFDADKKVQDMLIRNPAINTCWICMEFRIPSGKTLFRIDKLYPSHEIKHIFLKESLPVGVYENCILHIETYRINDGKRMNCSDYPVDLYILE